MLEKLTSPFKEFGLGAGLIYALDRVFVRLSPGLRLKYFELMVQPIVDQPLAPPSATRNVELREIRPGDPELEQMPPPSRIIDYRFGQDAFCLGAYRKGVLIGYIWFVPRAYREDEARCTYLLEPVEESVFDFDLYIFPQYRLGRAFVAIWDGANRYLAGRGIRYTFSRMTRFNLISRRSHRHLGSRRLGRAVFLQLWGVELMVATVFPYLSLALPGRPGPGLKLHPRVLLESDDKPAH